MSRLHQSAVDTLDEEVRMRMRLAKQGKLQLQEEAGKRGRRNGTNDEAVEEGRWGRFR